MYVKRKKYVQSSKFPGKVVVVLHSSRLLSIWTPLTTPYRHYKMG
jgi:hypothetical protein